MFLSSLVLLHIFDCVSYKNSTLDDVGVTFD